MKQGSEGEGALGWGKWFEVADGSASRSTENFLCVRFEKDLHPRHTHPLPPKLFHSNDQGLDENGKGVFHHRFNSSQVHKDKQQRGLDRRDQSRQRSSRSSCSGGIAAGARCGTFDSTAPAPSCPSQGTASHRLGCLCIRMRWRSAGECSERTFPLLSQCRRTLSL